MQVIIWSMVQSRRETDGKDTEMLGLSVVIRLQTSLDSEASRCYMFAVIYLFTVIWTSLLFCSQMRNFMFWNEIKSKEPMSRRCSLVLCHHLLEGVRTQFACPFWFPSIPIYLLVLVQRCIFDVRTVVLPEHQEAFENHLLFPINKSKILI